jgi:hypothetical protein
MQSTKNETKRAKERLRWASNESSFVEEEVSIAGSSVELPLDMKSQACLGCFLSRVQLLKYFVDDSVDHAIIGEWVQLRCRHGTMGLHEIKTREQLL